MPRIGMDPENKAPRPFDYPRLSLDKNERARIVCIEKEPMVEYVHTLREVVLENGKPIVERVNRWGREVEENRYDFVGRYICPGDFDILLKKGVDPEGCPICRASLETDAVTPPERRYGMHVIRYKTQPGGFKVSEPFQVELLMWLFNERRWGQIVDFNEEWKDSGGLQAHDLLLGPCENATFQKYDMAVAQKSEWLTDDSRKKLVKATYDNNQAADVSSLIARRPSIDIIQTDLNRVLAAYTMAFGGKSLVPDLDADTEDAIPGGLDMFAKSTDEAEPASAETVSTGAKRGGTLDLDDLLS